MTAPFARLGLSSETILTIKSHSDREHTRAIAMHDQERASEDEDKEDVRFIGEFANLALIGTYMALVDEPDDPEPMPAELIHLPSVFAYHAPSSMSMGIQAWQVHERNMIVGPTMIHLHALPIYRPTTPEHVAVNAALRLNAERFVDTVGRLEAKRERIQSIAQRGNAAQELGRLADYLAKEQEK